MKLGSDWTRKKRISKIKGKYQKTKHRTVKSQGTSLFAISFFQISWNAAEIKKQSLAKSREIDRAVILSNFPKK